MALKSKSIKHLSSDEKIKLLEILGYGFDGTNITLNGELYLDPYTKEPLFLSNFAIMGDNGRVIVIDNNPVSIAGYAADYLVGVNAMSQKLTELKIINMWRQARRIWPEQKMAVKEFKAYLTDYE